MQINYNSYGTTEAFHKSNAFVRGIMGPIGSGKSVACCMEIFIRACQQRPNAEGIRKSRWLIVRNTLPELETTTMRTWLDWFPAGKPEDGRFGHITRKPPYTHSLVYYPGDGTKVDLEVQFIAMDSAADAKKLLSYECSGIFFNETRELKKEIIDAGTGRVGRYPSQKDGGCTHPCIIMDTNPPSDQHWWYKCSEEDAWAVDGDGNYRDPISFADEERWEFFRQPSGLSEDAENLENLNQKPDNDKLPRHIRRQHGRMYYQRMVAGKTQEWVNVYVHGDYGNIKQGQPVYGSSYNPDLHVAKNTLRINPGAKIYIGIDCSGRHPASVFAQKSSLGQIQILDELCVMGDEGMGAVQYSKMLRSYMDSEFPGHEFSVWGDPAGGFRSQNDEKTYYDILHANGIIVRAAPALRIPDRIQTVYSVLERLHGGGEAAMIISTQCRVLLQGFGGGYRYRKLQVSGEDRYTDKPEKNRYADVHDALQYLLAGMGETNKMKRRGGSSSSQTVIMKGWDIW
jgi:hypothetical protein